MKNPLVFKILFFSLFISCISSCDLIDKEDDEQSISVVSLQETDMQFANAIIFFDNDDMIDSPLVNSGADYLATEICSTSLPTGNITGFFLSFYLPSLNKSNIQTTLEQLSLVIDNGGTPIIIPANYLNITYHMDTYIDNVPYSQFNVGVNLGIYNGEISNESFEILNFEFTSKVTDTNTSETLYTGIKNVYISKIGC